VRLFCCPRLAEENPLHPTEPFAAVPTAAAPAPADPMQTLAAHLDDVMAQTEIAANAQRDEEATNPSAPVQGQEAPPAVETADDDEVDSEENEDEATPADEAPEATPADAPAEQPKYSRRDAARFAAELEQRNKDLADAQAIVAKAQGEVAAHRAADQHIVQQLGEVSGYTREANGRFKIENLTERVLSNVATDEERQELAEMKQWALLAGPIYREAERQVTRAFSVDWGALTDLEGVGEAGLAKLNQAPNGVAGAREIHALAYAAGKKAAQDEAKATIARLKADTTSTKIKLASGAAQPAVVAGAAVPSTGGFRNRAFNADGSINDDFDREVRAGRWLGADLSS
jgi:hypothetical protein